MATIQLTPVGEDLKLDDIKNLVAFLKHGVGLLAKTRAAALTVLGLPVLKNHIRSCHA